MFHGISIVVQGSTVRPSSYKSFLMPLSLVCDTKKMSMLDLNSKRVICPSMQGKHERLCIDRYWSSLKYSFCGQNTKRTSRVSGIINHLDITLYHCFM